MSIKLFLFRCFSLLFISVLFLQPLVVAGDIIPAAPSINAKSYIMMDFDSGNILVEENSDEKLPPASLTKIMTVYVVASELEEERIKLGDLVTISKKAWRMPGSRMFIEVGKQVSVDDLLKGIIIQSGNDASVAIAEYVSGSEEGFASLMNEHARKLGMNNTNFENSTGLPSEQHYTTARDLAILAKALIRDFPDIYQLHSVKEFTFNKINQKNRNKLLWLDPSVDGLKTGHTDAAGYCLVASAKREDMRLITVVMGTDGVDARAKASQSLLKYGFRFFETHRLYKADEVIKTVKVWKGKTSELNLGLQKDLILTIPRGQSDKLKAHVETEETILAPVKKGEGRGVLVLSISGEEVLETPLISLNDIEEGNLISKLKDDLQLLLDKVTK